MSPEERHETDGPPADDSLLWYTALHHLIDEVVFIHREDRSIAFVSPSVERVLGYTPAEFTQLSTPELIHPDDLPAAVDAAVRLRAEPGCSYRSTLRIRRADGSWLWVEIVGQNLLEEPRVRGLVQTLRDVSERRDLEEQLLYQARHDALTGLANRRYFLEVLERAVRSEPMPSFAVVYLDLDEFKPINDRLGHGVGDDVLREVGRRLQQSARARDLPARLGGDEFVVLCYGIDDHEAAHDLGRRIHDAVAGPVRIAAEVTVDVRTSVGVAWTRSHGTVDELVARADAALYRAKARGGGVAVDPSDGGVGDG